MRKVGGHYRDQYFEEFVDYLRKRTDKERKAEGKKIYADSMINTMATDTFFLEKREEKEFGYWFQNEQTMKEAYECLWKHLARRKRVDSDVKNYFNDMKLFAEFLVERNNM